MASASQKQQIQAEQNDDNNDDDDGTKRPTVDGLSFGVNIVFPLQTTKYNLNKLDYPLNLCVVLPVSLTSLINSGIKNELF